MKKRDFLFIMGGSALALMAFLTSCEKETYDMSNVSFENATFTYDGTEKKLEISGTLPEGVTVEYSENTLKNAGSVEVIARFKGSEKYAEIPDMKATLTINKATYDMSGVTYTDTSFTYDGNEHELLVSGTLPEGVSVSYTNNKLTNFGETTAVAKFTGDSTNYNEIPDKSAKLSCTKATYDMSGVTFASTEFTYDGNEHELLVSGTLPEGVTVSYTNNKLTNFGETTAVAKFVGDSINYNAIPDKSAKFSCTKATYDMSGVTFASTEFTYDGTVKSLAISGTLPEGVTVSYSANNALTNVGEVEVTATFTGDSNHQAIVSKTAKLKINKAQVSIPEIEVLSFIYTGEEIEVDIPESLLYEIDGNKGTNAGTDYYYTLSLVDTSNYEWEDGTVVDIEVDWEITKKLINKPTANKTSFVYNGEEQGPVFASSSEYDVKGNSATNAGNQVAIISLKDNKNTAWEDGKTNALNINWEIAKADYDSSGITFADGEFTYDGTEKSITVANLPAGAKVDYANNVSTNVCEKNATATITVSNNYKPFTLNASFTVNKATNSLTSDDEIEIKYGENIVVTSAFGTPVLTYYNSSKEVLDEAPTTVGTYYVKASVSDSTNYGSLATDYLPITISKATYDLSGITFEDTSYEYDGTAKTLAISGTLPEGVTVTYSANNNLTNVGSNEVTASFTGDDTNYELINDQKAKLIVTKKVEKIGTYEELVSKLTGSLSHNFDLSGYTANGRNYLYQLTADIVCPAESEWKAVGTAQNPFNSEFDGNGYSITGLNVTEADESDEGNSIMYGFFGSVGCYAEIHNVTFTNCEMNVLTDTEYGYGLMVGFIYGGRSDLDKTDIDGEGFENKIYDIEINNLVINIEENAKGTVHAGGLVGFEKVNINGKRENITINGLELNYSCPLDVKAYVGTFAGSHNYQGEPTESTYKVCVANNAVINYTNTNSDFSKGVAIGSYFGFTYQTYENGQVIANVVNLIDCSTDTVININVRDNADLVGGLDADCLPSYNHWLSFANIYNDIYDDLEDEALASSLAYGVTINNTNSTWTGSYNRIDYVDPVE